MILGVDVGGTHTDAVLIDRNGVFRETKTLTGDDLLETLRDSLEKTFHDIDPGQIERMAFSTTMATNAIVQDQLEDTGMIVSCGPGMNPNWFSVGPSFHIVEGCLDHQGFEALPLNKQSVLDASARIREKGIKTIGVVGKFSIRNPAHEIRIAEWTGSSFFHVALGHQVSGILNFPRRITTTYLNAALHNIHQQFSSALLHILDEKKLDGPRYLLKPDGGTVDLEQIGASPAQTAQSGPAASVMGALALDGCPGTTLVLDIGGTTTDMAVVLNGVPLLDPYGIKLGPFQTLIRSLLTYSIGIGGDSEVRTGDSGNLKIGPLRKGNPAAFGGPVPTPTDAMVVLGLLKDGNKNSARAAMKKLAAPLGLDVLATAERVLEHTAKIIADSAHAFVRDINSRPVYTIHEVLENETIALDSVVIIGGPAPQLAGYVAKAIGLPHRVPSHFGVANAVGAALARVTSEITLQADTERGSVIIPEANIQNRIDYDFGLDTAIALGHEVLRKNAIDIGADPETLEISTTEQQMFNMIRGYSRTGQNIRLKMCITPGLIPEWMGVNPK